MGFLSCWFTQAPLSFVDQKDQKDHLLVGKDIVLRFIIEYSSLMDFGP